MVWDEIRQLMFVKGPNCAYIVGCTTCSPSIRLFLVSRTGGSLLSYCFDTTQAG
jgi:hypothetical protein